MLLAAIGDIHGNLMALDAALRIIDDLGIHTIVNTGDVVAGYPFSKEVIQRIQTQRIPTVQGMFDRYVASFRRKGAHIRKNLSPEDAAAIESTHGTLQASDIEYLHELPRRLSFTLESIPIFVCHGAPESQGDELTKDDDERRFSRAREYANAQLIICGKTHRPFCRQVADALFVNPGSLGLGSGDKPIGTFAIIDTDASPWRVHFRRVPLVPA